MGQAVNVHCSRPCAPEKDGLESVRCCAMRDDIVRLVEALSLSDANAKDGIGTASDDTHLTSWPSECNTPDETCPFRRQATGPSPRVSEKICPVELIEHSDEPWNGYVEGPIDTSHGNYRCIDLECGGTYEGQVKPGNNCFHGVGLLATSSSRAFGEWKDGKLHGRACQKWPDGRVYSGQHIDGAFDGTGRMQWPHRRGLMVYEGGYLADAKHGEGKFTWPSGKTFWGYWSHGHRHGIGVDTSASGQSICGAWEDDVFSHFVELESLPPSLRAAVRGPIVQESTSTAASECSLRIPH